MQSCATNNLWLLCCSVRSGAITVLVVNICSVCCCPCNAGIRSLVFIHTLYQWSKVWCSLCAYTINFDQMILQCPIWFFPCQIFSRLFSQLKRRVVLAPTPHLKPSHPILSKMLHGNLCNIFHKLKTLRNYGSWHVLFSAVLFELRAFSVQFREHIP